MTGGLLPSRCGQSVPQVRDRKLSMSDLAIIRSMAFSNPLPRDSVVHVETPVGPSSGSVANQQLVLPPSEISVLRTTEWTSSLQ
jgi:hypothetical protein